MKSLIISLIGLISIFQLRAQSPNLEILVHSRPDNEILKFDGTGIFISSFINSGGLSLPEDLLFHPDGRILVTGFGNTAIKSYNKIDGSFLGDFSSNYSLSNPSKMRLGPDSLIYVTQWGSGQEALVRFGLDGEYVDTFIDSVPKALGILWDADSNLYVSSFGTGANGVIKKYSQDGDFISDFVDSQILNGPTDIWWDGTDLMVEDWSSGKLLRYDSLGGYVGTEHSNFTSPEGIAFYPNGDYLIGDWGLDGVHLIDSAGVYQGLLISGSGLKDPNGVHIRENPSLDMQENQELSFKLWYDGRKINLIFEEIPEGMVQIKIYTTNGQYLGTYISTAEGQVSLSFEYPTNLDVGIINILVGGELFSRTLYFNN